MSTIIAFISQKGGVGKSTFARALATVASSHNLKVKIADLDTQQGTSLDWHRIRLNANINPIVYVEAFSSAKEALKISEEFDLLIIDGPARTSKGTLEIAQHADLIIQPTGASIDDLKPAVKEFHALIKEGISRNKLLFALNHIGTEAEDAECRRYIQEAGYSILNGYLPERPAYRQAQNNGCSITETPYKGLKSKAETVIQSIIDNISND